MFGDCVPNPCVALTGACCNTALGTCTITTQSACTFSWLGPGVACNTVTCPVPPPPGLVLIPAGSFTMGSPPSELGRYSNEIQHQVTLTRAILLSDHEVTQAEWQAVMQWNESTFPGSDRPVEQVTWYDAVSYCNQLSADQGLTPAYTITAATYGGDHITGATVAWIQAASGYRLLTEAEWEYTCRATSARAFCNGDIADGGDSCTPLDPNLGLVGWYCGNAVSTTHVVGGKTANFWGLDDMHGNVREWCWDRYAAYAGDVTDPAGPASGSDRVIRGGAWNSSARYCRSAYRSILFPGDRTTDLGVRVCRNAP